MKNLKVVTVIGTRPEIIRLSRILVRLDENFEHVIVHTGQNYDIELNKIFFDDLSLREPDYYLNSAELSQSPSNTIGNIISSVDILLEDLKPDALLVLGDTNSCLSVIPAKRRKIPIFHFEAGNRCFDERVPEEINRKIVDHVADVNLTYSSIAKEYLIKEGIPQDRVIKLGSPMAEVLGHYSKKISSSLILEQLNLEKQNFFVVSLHREENIENQKNILKIAEIINGISSSYNLPVIVSTHPRTRMAFEKHKMKFDNNVVLLKPLNFTDYCQLQQNARAVLSDSGTITEESSILNFPALNLRETHERPEGMEEGVVMLVGLNLDRVFQGLKILAGQSRDDVREIELVKDYKANNISNKMIRIIVSYTDYVKRVVWKEY